jgi:hypothetical protein
VRSLLVVEELRGRPNDGISSLPVYFPTGIGILSSGVSDYESGSTEVSLIGMRRRIVL